MPQDEVALRQMQGLQSVIDVPHGFYSPSSVTASPPLMWRLGCPEHRLARVATPCPRPYRPSSGALPAGQCAPDVRVRRLPTARGGRPRCARRSMTHTPRRPSDGCPSVDSRKAPRGLGAFLHFTTCRFNDLALRRSRRLGRDAGEYGLLVLRTSAQSHPVRPQEVVHRQALLWVAWRVRRAESSFRQAVRLRRPNWMPFGRGCSCS